MRDGYEVLDWLNELYPEKSPRLGENHDDLMHRAGQRSVVNKLKEKLEAEEMRRKLNNVHV